MNHSPLAPRETRGPSSSRTLARQALAYVAQALYRETPLLIVLLALAPVVAYVCVAFTPAARLPFLAGLLAGLALGAGLVFTHAAHTPASSSPSSRSSIERTPEGGR